MIDYFVISFLVMTMLFVGKNPWVSSSAHLIDVETVTVLEMPARLRMASSSAHLTAAKTVMV
jgi:hypothetical protein